LPAVVSWSARRKRLLKPPKLFQEMIVVTEAATTTMNRVVSVERGEKATTR